MAIFLNRAIDLSGMSQGGPFGAVVVKDNIIIGEGFNQVVPTCDPTAHAEVVAIRDAATRMRTHDLSGCTLYASTEPCPLCLASCYWAKIGKVVYANDRHHAEDIGFSDKFIYEQFLLPHTEKSIKMVRLPNQRAETIINNWNGQGY